MQKGICHVILESHRPRNGSLMFVPEGSRVYAACPGITNGWLWSTPRLFVRATCSRGGGSPHHLVTSLWHSMGNEILVLSTCCHRMPMLELWVQQRLLACLHTVEILFEQLISVPYRQLPSVRFSDLPFFQRTIIHLGPWCLTALIMCVWKKINLFFSFMSFSDDDISFF